MNKIFERVAAWNSARYEQEYNHELTIALLREEYQEYIDATDDVAKLDALCDIAYVAMGGIWKLGLDFNNPAIEAASDTMNALLDIGLEPVHMIAYFLDLHEFAKVEPLYLYNVLCCAHSQMFGFGFSAAQTIEALSAVCDSNDSKSIKKTASSVKANAGDKGAFYKPPTAALTELLCQSVKH